MRGDDAAVESGFDLGLSQLRQTSCSVNRSLPGQCEACRAPGKQVLARKGVES